MLLKAPRNRGDLLRTLVLLPGLDGTDVFLRPLTAALPADITPLVVTYPDNAVSGCSYAALLAHVRRAVAALPDFHVLGWSFGGPLALMLAAAEPDRVRGVILTATFVRAPGVWLRRLRWLATGGVVWAYRAARRVCLRILRSPADPWRRATGETWGRVSARAIAGRLHAVVDLDARASLLACRQPVLYLASSTDRIVPSDSVAEIVRARPSVRVVALPGRHMALFTHPEAAARVIVAFVRGGRASGPQNPSSRPA